MQPSPCLCMSSVFSVSVCVCLLSSLSIVCLQPFIPLWGLQIGCHWPPSFTFLGWPYADHFFHVSDESPKRERWNRYCILGEWGNEDRWSHRWSAPSYHIHQTYHFQVATVLSSPTVLTFLGAFQVLYRQVDSLLHGYTNNLILLVLAFNVFICVVYNFTSAVHRPTLL